MSKIHMCPKCSKVLANRHSLSRHKKNCRGGSVLPFKHKDLLENEKKRLRDQLNPKFTIFPENKDDVSSDESIKSDTESVDSTDLVWRWLVFLAHDSKQPVLQVLAKLLTYYRQKGSELFQKMISDVEYAKDELDYSEEMAFEYTLAKNKDAIIEMVNNCEMHKGNIIFCSLAGRKQKPGCLWFSGERCRCCDGISALHVTGEFLEVYYGMRHDGLMKKINEEINDRIGEDEVHDDDKLFKLITEVVEKHRKEVMEEVTLAGETIGDNEWENMNEHKRKIEFEKCDCVKD